MIRRPRRRKSAVPKVPQARRVKRALQRKRNACKKVRRAPIVR